MIPKIVHYCWFGQSRMPIKLKRNIETWKKMNPDFTFIEWNERNFDIQLANNFVKEAYRNREWAFVSDYVRLYVIYKYGGFYFDTDVKLLKKLDDVEKTFPNGFMGFQNNEFVNSGLGIASKSGSEIIKEMLEIYNHNKFAVNKKIDFACPIINTQVLKKYGLIQNNSMQLIKEITILPTEYLSPITLSEGKKKVTKNTIAIHEYNGSWMKWTLRLRMRFILFIKKLLPNSVVQVVKRMYKEKKDD